MEIQNPLYHAEMAIFHAAMALEPFCKSESLSGKFSLWKHCPLSIFAHVALKA
jgi:hypothetical protein